MARQGPMGEELYENDRLARLYDTAYVDRDDFVYCKRLGAQARSVLDLGCGTGELACALAPGRWIVGVDPAGAMLEVARRREGGRAVEWVREDARGLRLGRRFDLVVLTGHAFQVFLSDADQAQVLATIATHLEPHGRFVLDTRNPAIGIVEHIEREAYGGTLEHPTEGRFTRWNASRYDPERCVLDYTNGFRFVDTGEELSASASIRYTPRDALADRLDVAGLWVERWLGTWRGEPFDEHSSPEIIPVGGRRK